MLAEMLIKTQKGHCIHLYSLKKEKEEEFS